MCRQNTQIGEADHLRKKRAALLRVKEILEPFGDFIAVVEGASVSGYSHDGVVKKLRETLRQYELEHGEDPDHDWSGELGT